MPLVDYPESEDSDSTEAQVRGPEEGNRLNERRKPLIAAEDSLPALPGGFLDLYASKVRTSTQDDPTLHEGRQRQVPHVEGNWPTHVYIEWFPTTEEIEKLESVIDRVQTDASPGLGHGKVQSLLRSDLNAPLPLHISLSSSLNIQLQQHETLLNRLQSGVVAARVPSFTLQTSSVGWTPNSERTRWFLVLRLSSNEHLARLFQIVNETARGMGQPELYKTSSMTAVPSRAASVTEQRSHNPEIGRPSGSDPSAHCHISIAWSLEPHEGLQMSQIPVFDVPVNSVKAKIGNMIHSIPLSREASTVQQSYLGS